MWGLHQYAACTMSGQWPLSCWRPSSLGQLFSQVSICAQEGSGEWHLSVLAQPYCRSVSGSFARSILLRGSPSMTTIVNCTSRCPSPDVHLDLQFIVVIVLGLPLFSNLGNLAGDDLLKISHKRMRGEIRWLQLSALPKTGPNKIVLSQSCLRKTGRASKEGGGFPTMGSRNLGGGFPTMGSEKVCRCYMQTFCFSARGVKVSLGRHAPARCTCHLRSSARRLIFCAKALPELKVMRSEIFEREVCGGFFAGKLSCHFCPGK